VGELIVARDVTIRYGRVVLFKDLSLRAEGVTLLVGPNGVGKSSLLRCIAGGNNCSGYIEVDGKVVQNGTKGLPPEKRGLAYLPQSGLAVPNLRVEEALSMINKYDEEVLEALGLNKLLDKRVGELSGGQLKRLSLALVLLSGKRAWLLDEPLAGVDKEGRSEIAELVARYSKSVGATVLWATHLQEPREVADRIITLGDEDVL